MKKQILLGFTLFTTVSITFSQGFYLGAKVGYGLGAANSNVGFESTSTNLDYSGTDRDVNTNTTKVVNGSYGLII
jgi:hypothetical protein